MGTASQILDTRPLEGRDSRCSSCPCEKGISTLQCMGGTLVCIKHTPQGKEHGYSPVHSQTKVDRRMIVDSICRDLEYACCKVSCAAEAGRQLQRYDWLCAAAKQSNKSGARAASWRSMLVPLFLSTPQEKKWHCRKVREPFFQPHLPFSFKLYVLSSFNIFHLSRF